MIPDIALFTIKNVKTLILKSTFHHGFEFCSIKAAVVDEQRGQSNVILAAFLKNLSAIHMYCIVPPLSLHSPKLALPNCCNGMNKLDAVAI